MKERALPSEYRGPRAKLNASLGKEPSRSAASVKTVCFSRWGSSAAVRIRKVFLCRACFSCPKTVHEHLAVRYCTISQKIVTSKHRTYTKWQTKAHRSHILQNQNEREDMTRQISFVNMNYSTYIYIYKILSYTFHLNCIGVGRSQRKLTYGASTRPIWDGVPIQKDASRETTSKILRCKLLQKEYKTLQV